jgi:hypothetical protein
MDFTQVQWANHWNEWTPHMWEGVNHSNARGTQLKCMDQGNWCTSKSWVTWIIAPLQLHFGYPLLNGTSASTPLLLHLRDRTSAGIHLTLHLFSCTSTITPLQTHLYNCTTGSHSSIVPLLWTGDTQGTFTELSCVNHWNELALHNRKAWVTAMGRQHYPLFHPESTRWFWASIWRSTL